MGIYWSSIPVGYTYATSFQFWKAFPDIYHYNDRSIGRNVRPVADVISIVNPVVSDYDAFSQTIYNIYGIKVADNAADMNALPSGIYIVNGKKFVFHCR